MSSALTPEHRSAALTVAQALADVTLYPAGLKAVVGAVREYQQALERLVMAALNRGMSLAEFRSDHKALIGEFARPAYLEGLQSGGVEELDDDDDDAVTAWVKDQRSYVNDFAKLVTAARGLAPAERASASKEAIARVVLWVQALEALHSLGKASALKNMAVTWRLGRTEEHCTTCATLNNKRHRLKWFTDRGYIPREPGSESLECGGWNCDCRLVDDKGKTVLP